MHYPSNNAFHLCHRSPYNTQNSRSHTSLKLSMGGVASSTWDCAKPVGPYYDKQRRFSMGTSSHPLIISSRRSSASFESCEDFSTIAETHFSTGSPLVMFLERFLMIRGGFGGFKDGQSKKTCFFYEMSGAPQEAAASSKM